MRLATTSPLRCGVKVSVYAPEESVVAVPARVAPTWTVTSWSAAPDESVPVTVTSSPKTTEALESSAVSVGATGDDSTAGVCSSA